MKERMDKQGDAEVNEAYADFEERYKTVAEKVKKANAMMDTDYVAAAESYAELERDPDYELYEDFKDLDNELRDLSKMWLTAKSTEEAGLVASAIPSYRAAMVKVLQSESAEERRKSMQELTTLMNDFYAKFEALQPKKEGHNR